NVKGPFQKQQTIETSFYKVQADYRDPFLGKFPKKKRTIKRIKKTVKPKTTVPFPRVIYNGIIQGNKSKAYILTINGRQEIVKLGAKFQGVKLIKANTKQAVVKFRGVQKIILLQ
ncbi:MAG: hypothetical protein ACWIPI_08820, partial [Polaribacter sp.]